MVASWLTAVRNSLPRGLALDDDAFARRHLALRVLLLAHVPVLAAVGAAQDVSALRLAVELLAVSSLAWYAGSIRRRRPAATLLAAGFVLASVVLVDVSGGAVEARFHILVALGVVGLYQDWVPFLATVTLATAAQVAGTALVPERIVDHGAGRAEPWTWAAVHAGTVLAAAAVQLALWRAIEVEHRKGVRLAAELARAQSQIEARESVSELFVNLARRNQALLDRQIDLIVTMEERETDPEQLGQLFQLDHLATRIRRNAESLLVLSGEEPPRRWGRPVPLTDVVRAAVAEVEDYRRVDVAVDETVAIAGRAVADLAHLLAELVENGLQFSPPESRVRVTSVVRPDRTCVLAVEDRGIGLTEVDLSSVNDLLARPPEVDLRLSKRLGFHVVSRLAARYRLSVKLAATPGGGTTATIVVPEDLVAPADAPVAPVAPAALTRAPRPQPAAPTVAGRVLAPAAAPAAGVPAPPATMMPAATTRPAAPASTVHAAGHVVAAPPAGRAPRPVVPAPVAATVPAAPAPAPAARPTPAPAPPAPLAPTTAPAPGGLPRRVPQAHLNPQLLGGNGAAGPAAAAAAAPARPAAAAPLPPERRRSLLSNFQAAQERARREVAGSTPASSYDGEQEP